MRVMRVVAARVAVEREEEQAEHVERGHRRGNRSEEPDDGVSVRPCPLGEWISSLLKNPANGTHRDGHES